MLNVLDKKNINKNIKTKSLNISDIENFYTSKLGFHYGIEYERLSLDKNTYKNADYKTMENILREFSILNNWELIFDDDTIIAIKDYRGNMISLEPGCQLEISLIPKRDILSIYYDLAHIIGLIDEVASRYDVIFLGYGINPNSSSDEIKIFNKKRYQIMSRYLPYQEYGELSLKMMKQTCSVQINIDYQDKIDAYYKLKFFNLIAPFVSGLSANSSFEKNNFLLKNSQRGHIWQYTSRERCNFFYKNIFNRLFEKKNLFKNYINEILDIPMIYIERNNETIEINGQITFRDFMKNGFLSYHATYEDYILHQSLCFPDVRLKNYIEIRNIDSQDLQTAIAFCAFYKGLSLSDIKYNLRYFNYLEIDDIEENFSKINEFGLNTMIYGNIDGWNIVSKLLNISKKYLSSQERTYLAPLLFMIKNKKTKSDLILEYGISNTKELIEFLR